jgi:hypothetical protein
MFLFRAMGSASPHIYCRALTVAVARLARGLYMLRLLAGLERQPEDP